MAGTAILEKNLKQTANLNITDYSNIPLATGRCLCLVQPQVVEQNDNTKHRHMQADTTNYCLNSSSKYNRSLINNYNIKTQQHHQHHHHKCPLTFGLIIIMLLAIVITEMPLMVKAKPLNRALTLDLTLTDDAKSESSDLLIVTSEEDEEEMTGIRQKVDISSAAVSSADSSLTSLEVLKYIQRHQQHQDERKRRHRKRNIQDLVIRKYLHQNANNLEWSNPCNGVFQLNSNEFNRKLYLKNFRKTVKDEQSSHDFSASAINIADIKIWHMHVDRYSFLPKLNRNGNITLSRWYRDMQTYVASFGYLARTQYNFDKEHQIFNGEISEDLNKLLISARHLLCELETTINGSFPINNLKKLKTISVETMNEKLRDFLSKRNDNRSSYFEAETLDLKFTKYNYLKFVSNMHTILNRKLRIKNKSRKHSSEENRSFAISRTMLDDDNSSSLSKNSNAKTDSRLSMDDSFEMLTKSLRKH